MTVYVDSNYWVYWMDSRLPAHRHVLKTVEAAVREGILLNLLSLLEVAHYFRNLGETELLLRMDKLRNLTTLTLAELDATTANEALRILGKYSNVGIGGRDAAVLATMRMHGVKRILTHDRDFRRVKGISVVDSIPARM